MDVHIVFLHDDLHEEIYICLTLSSGLLVLINFCCLNKLPYGLRQAPWCWFAKLITSFHQCGFSQSYADYSLFTYTHKDIFFLYYDI